jgi:putative acetyltransferase
MPDRTTFRAERAEDAATVDTIVAAAFGRRHEADIVRRVRPGRALVSSMVALRDGLAVAHVLFSRVGIPQLPSVAACALGPVAVEPRLQGTGIGSALIDTAIARLPSDRFELLFVLGNPRYYGRFGFELAAAHGYHYASHDFDRAFQVRALRGAITPAQDAWVTYHAAFDE